MRGQLMSGGGRRGYHGDDYTRSALRDLVRDMHGWHFRWSVQEREEHNEAGGGVCKTE